MKETFRDLFGFIYSLRLGDYFFFIGTFILIILFIYVIYLIKLSEEENKDVGLEGELFDLAQITRAIEEEYKPGRIELTGYEEEQENNAIISYEELVKNKDKVGLYYDDEYVFENKEITVKKISLSVDGEVPESKLEVKLMHYDKEEAFLKALKKLQKDLTN